MSVSLQKMNGSLFIQPNFACGPGGCAEINRGTVRWSRGSATLQFASVCVHVSLQFDFHVVEMLT